MAVLSSSLKELEKQRQGRAGLGSRHPGPGLGPRTDLQGAGSGRRPWGLVAAAAGAEDGPDTLQRRNCLLNRRAIRTQSERNADQR